MAYRKKDNIIINYNKNTYKNENLISEEKKVNFIQKNKIKLIITFFLTILILISLIVIYKKYFIKPSREEIAIEMKCGDPNDPYYNIDERRKNIQEFKQALRLSNTFSMNEGNTLKDGEIDHLGKMLDDMISRCKRKQVTYEKFPSVNFEKLSTKELENFLLNQTPPLKESFNTKDNILEQCKFGLTVSDEMLKENTYLLEIYEREQNKYREEIIKSIQNIIFDYYYKEEENDTGSN